jgi:hypothetical protein
MPSIIRATTTNGLQVAPDNSGSLVLQTNGTTTAVTIDTSQNVGIGTTTMNGKFNSTPKSTFSATGTTWAEAALSGQGAFGGGLSMIDGSAGYILSVQDSGATFTIRQGTVGSTATERMRIDSNGNVLVGTTDLAATSGVGVKIYNSSYTDTGVSVVAAATANTSTAYRLYSTGAGAYRFYVGYAGTIYATSTTITGISDQRFKENIRDLDDGLETIMSLKPRKFDWKEGKGKDIKGDRGFIAQEFEQVFPDMVEEWADPAPEGEEPYKAVNANLIPTLVKAIQEQQTIINDLKARIETLEAK